MQVGREPVEGCKLSKIEISTPEKIVFLKFQILKIWIFKNSRDKNLKVTRTTTGRTTEPWRTTQANGRTILDELF